MNPFDLNGPQFLWFYGVLGAVSYLFVRVYITYRERQLPIPKLNLSDPFQIAFLRGNRNETIRIATLTLIDRGLVDVSGTSSFPTLATTDPHNINIGKTRIERAVLRLFRARQEATAAFKDEDCKRACESYGDQLGEDGLVRTKEIILERLVPMGGVALLLLGLSLMKIFAGLDRGRTNIAFLIILTALLMVLFVRLILRHRTGLGDRVLSDLKTLFHPLYMRRDSLRRSRQTSEAALLAAVFGISALPASFQFARDIFRKAAKRSYGSSCGSTLCGSSGGSSCGSTGCGGGCGSGGGCGGCGS